MNGWQVFAVGIAAAVAVCVVAVTVSWLWPTRIPQGRSVAEIRDRVEQEDALMDRTIWPVGYPHEAPAQPMGVIEAQLTMQRHRTCQLGVCPRKTVAWNVLVEAGVIIPAVDRAR